MEPVRGKGQLHAQKCDLTKEDDILALFAWIKDNLGGVDVCINNAGVSDYNNKLLTSSSTTTEGTYCTYFINN